MLRLQLLTVILVVIVVAVMIPVGKLMTTKLERATPAALVRLLAALARTVTINRESVSQ